MRRVYIEKGNFYHIYNRGAGRHEIFRDNYDYLVFLKKIRELNNNSTSGERDFILRELSRDKPGLGYPKPGLSFCSEYFEKLSKFNKLVDIICYSLLPNHYHFILKQLVDGGIKIFMHKLGTSYVKYFNNKYKASGVLFQGSFKAYPTGHENNLCRLSAYINCNYQIHKLGSVKSWQFSSYRDYLGVRQGNLASKDIILDLFESADRYREYCEEVILAAQYLKRK